tara:strand:- start:507 stop:2888 length:2382 start_codon:yes stop_codon:yes gene_type:complete
MKQKKIPVLPLRDIVVFPTMVAPLFVGRKLSINALNTVINNNKQILLVTQKNSSVDNPLADDLYKFGTIAQIIQLLKLPDGTIKVLVEGIERAKIDKIIESEDYISAEISSIKNKKYSLSKIKALTKIVIDQFESYQKIDKKVPVEILASIKAYQDSNKIADMIISNLNLDIPKKQDLLETLSTEERLNKIYKFLLSEIDTLQIEKKIKGRVKRQMEKTQKEYYLNEQMKAIQKELGDEDFDDLKDLENKINEIKMSVEAKEKSLSELKKLKSMSPMSAEATVVRNYIEWIISIPWNKPSKILKDISKARKILDHDHHGLIKVKDRIIEYLAVQKRTSKLKGPILCLVGPPGVGKTSLGKSIASAVGRNFVRMSLGGIRDEAEIRGHRRTYIGSMPGKFIQSMKKSKSSNPLFLLDEVDKLGADWRGDPSSALLEVLDPEQNNTFSDHYLEVDYDLSDVMFICTANTLNIPAPLLDRMEIIRIPGYTEKEKSQIAKKFLIPKQLGSNGLNKKEIRFNLTQINKIIRYYTREAGVRGLEKEISKICRKSVKELETSKKTKIILDNKNLIKFLGVEKYRKNEGENKNLIGVTNGLAWTEVGGELLSIEVSLSLGKGKMTITGKLGEVMKESVQAATSFVKSQAHILGIHHNKFDKYDIHVHVPEGATPKDGPSAGIAIFNSLVSSLTSNKVRKDVAMTGEITLRGRVLPIGGLKEKLYAAVRAGIKTVLIPQENEKDLIEIDKEITEALKLVSISDARSVLKYSLSKPLILSESEKIKPINPDISDENLSKNIAH